MAIYLEYDGIKGDVTAKGYEDHINLLSAHFAVKRDISMEVGNLNNRESTRPRFNEIYLNKIADKSITDFFKESVVGTEGKTVKIKFVHTGGDQIQEYMVYELSDVLISRYKIEALDPVAPVEFISLSYSKAIVSYSGYDKGNIKTTPKREGYDLKKAKAV